MPEITTPYLEEFEMADRPDGGLDCWFACNHCGRNVDDTPCPEHGPGTIPGLRVAECDATPPHPVVYSPDRDDYGLPCPYCMLDAKIEEHQGCAHSHHGRWRRWRITGRLVGWAARLGVVTAWMVSWGDGCEHCVSKVTVRGRRSHFLGVSRKAWECLFRGHHIRGREVPYMLGMCHRCLHKFPCPDCGSVAVDADGFPTHEAGCGDA